MKKVFCFVFLVLLNRFAWAQSAETISQPIEKYNGYGLPNSQFKKIKVAQSNTATHNAKSTSSNQSLDSSLNADEETLVTPAYHSNTPPIRKKNIAPLTKKEDSFFKLSLSVELSYSTFLDKKLANGDHPEATGLELDPSLQIGDYTLGGVFSYTYDLHEPTTGTDWDDGQIFISRKAWSLGDYLKLGPTLSFDLPFSTESRENRTMKLITNGGLTLSLNSKNAGNENVTLSYSASYGSYSNDYTTRADGVTPTYKYRVVQVVTTGYKINAVSLLALFSFSSNYSYEDVVRNSFKHLEAISYTLPNQVTISLYHVNKGPLLKANTYENNLDFYNQETSVLTLGVSTSF